jgi:cytidine deaminase
MEMTFEVVIDGQKVDITRHVAEHRDVVYRVLRAAAAESDDGAFRGVVSSRATAVATAAGLGLDALADALVPVAAEYAHVPVSHFHVGAVARCGDRFYLGTNMEYVGGPIGLSVHGEQCALMQALVVGCEPAVDCIAVNAAPCGHCRQFIAEQEWFQGEGSSAKRPHPIAIRIANKHVAASVVEMLLLPFTPAALTLLPVPDPARLAPPASLPGPLATLACEALDALRRSRAPFSGLWSGVAIEVAGRKMFSGPYIEVAAYNPSMLPLNVAIIAARFAGHAPQDI